MLLTRWANPRSRGAGDSPVNCGMPGSGAGRSGGWIIPIDMISLTPRRREVDLDHLASVADQKKPVVGFGVQGTNTQTCSSPWQRPGEHRLGRLDDEA